MSEQSNEYLSMLHLALASKVPLIYVRTDDPVHAGDVLSFLAGQPVRPLAVPEVIPDVSALKVPEGEYHYTSQNCASMVKLYHFAKDNGITIVFVNTEKSVVHFDGGQLIPPKKLVTKFLAEQLQVQNPEALIPSFGGMGLKDIREAAMMTMTRDESLTPNGIRVTRGGYRNLKGIQQVPTEMRYYREPKSLTEYLNKNAPFFIDPVHDALVPRGLLFDGPPGTGKTAAAKAIANRLGVPLFHLDISAMKGKYVGDSEGNLAAALDQVDQVEPCVVILDEVEKIFQSQGDSGVTSSMLSQLLWWLQEHKSRVFTVMTTNDKSAIPAELYRPGRIDDVMQFLGINEQGEGYEFAKGAFDALVAEIGGEADEEHYAMLLKETQSIYAVAEGAVPQVKLTGMVTSLIKELVSDGEEDQPQEAQAA